MSVRTFRSARGVEVRTNGHKRRREPVEQGIEGKRRRRLARLVARDGGYCRACGTTESLTVDEIVPRSRGGTNDPENQQVLCEDCNQLKADHLPGELGWSMRLAALVDPTLLVVPEGINAAPCIEQVWQGCLTDRYARYSVRGGR